MNKSNTVAVKATSSKKIQNANGNLVGAKANNASIPLQYVRYLRSEDVRVADGSLFKWTGTHFQIESRQESESQASDWLEQTHSGEFSSFKFADLVNSGLARLTRLGPQANDVIPTLGGYVWLEQDSDGKYSYQVKPHDESCNFRYCINATLPTDAAWLKAKAGDSFFFRFINSILPDSEVCEFVQEYVGSTLLGDTRFQTAILFKGNGSNGKGTLVKTISKLHQNVASVDLQNLKGFGLEQLFGASLVVVDELPEGGFNDQTFKSLVSGDPVLCDRKYRSPILFNNTAKFILSGNHIPRKLDKSDGLWRRLKIVHFDTTIPEDQRDGQLHEKIIKNELGLVLKWALEGLIRLLNRGHFVDPKAIRDNIRQARVQSSSVLQHIEDEGALVHTPGQFTPKSQIYSAYRNWCWANGKNPEASDGFWKQVKHECKRLGIEVIDKQVRMNGKQTYCVDIAIMPAPVVEDDGQVSLTYDELMQKCKFAEVDGASNPFSAEKVAD